MGIRFLCPNGHKLNVKSFLAGKRGICPQCDAKFLVPEASGEQAVAVEEPVLDSGDLLDRGYDEPPLPPPMPAVQVSAGAELPPTEVWYVRTPAGDQFGPANADVMRGWVAEGRVAVDSWVWRTGWAEWKTGGQAISFLNGPPPQAMTQPVVPTMPTAPIADAPMPELPVANAAEPPMSQKSISQKSSSRKSSTSNNPKVQYRTSRRSRQERARKVTFFLGGVVLLLLAVLVVVLFQNSRR